jgi:hypothetical protein
MNESTKTQEWVEKMSNYKKLWEVQVGQFPDSVYLNDTQVLNLIMSAVPDWLRDMTWDMWDRKGDYDNDMEARLAFYEWREKEITKNRFIWAINAFSNRSQSSDGFFYACGKREDGRYKHIGFRTGLEPSDYSSGYMGLNYKENGK